MKKLALTLSALTVAALFSGCVANKPMGVFYSDIKTNYTEDVVYQSSKGVDVSKLKSGTSTAKGYFGMAAAIGDVTLTTAAKNGGIKNIYYVDWKVKSVLGFVEEYECTVWGD